MMKRMEGKDAAARLAWDMALRKLNRTFPQNVMQDWIDSFSLMELTEKRAVICYRGTKDLEEFREKYYQTFVECLVWALGREVEVDLYRGNLKEAKGWFRSVSIGKGTGKTGMPAASDGKRTGKKRAKRVILGLVALVAAAAVIIVAANVIMNQTFKESYYQVGSGKISENMRIIQISDLHSSSFGKDNEKLVKRIKELEPDLIVLTGDMIEERNGDADVTLDLCEQLTELAPVYFIYGNHETMEAFDSNDMSIEELDEITGCNGETRSSEAFWDMKDSLRNSLEDIGVHVLWNQCETLEIGKDQIDIYGVLTGHPYAFWEYAEDTYVEFRYENTDRFKLMLCHEPYIYETWEGESWADLSLSGHTHGGSIRIPYIGGLYEYRYGLFPEFGKNDHMISGQYDVSGKPLIISNGMSKKGLFRINNQPELVIVDVNRY